MARNAAIEIELALTDRYVDPVDTDYDAVLRQGPIAETSIAAREFRQARTGRLRVRPPSRRARNARDPGSLAEHASLGFVNASGLPYAVWRFTKDSTDHTINIRSRFQVNDGRDLGAAAAAGRGIFLQPEAVLRDHIARGSLVPVLADYRAPSRSMFLMFSARRPQPLKLRALIDDLVKAFPANGPGFA